MDVAGERLHVFDRRGRQDAMTEIEHMARPRAGGGMPAGFPGGMPQLPPGLDPNALGGGAPGLPPGFKLPNLDFSKLNKPKRNDGDKS